MESKLIFFDSIKRKANNELSESDYEDIFNHMNVDTINDFEQIYKYIDQKKLKEKLENNLLPKKRLKEIKFKEKLWNLIKILLN